MAGLETAPERIAQLNAAPPASGPVLYWMSRDQRVQGNWALALAQERAAQAKAPLAVLFCLADGFLDAQPWHFAFMLDGLRETSRELEKLNIPFFVLRGSPESEIPRFAQKCRAGLAVCDFDPLSIKQRWAERTAKALKMPLLEVDAHNIVPCRHVSQKREAGAYTLRPKLNRLLPGFLTDFPEIKRQKTAWGGPAPEKLPPSPEQKGTAGSRCIFSPGRAAALARLGAFAKHGLAAYENGRNDPSQDALSGLSPYLHFGQLGAQETALAVSKAKGPESARAAFLEQLIVRRELADNFCLYAAGYDGVQAFVPWARATLEREADTKREYLYTPAQFENATTHDELWNAAQTEIVLTGKMHGYMRMYWAKKILEWSADYKKAYAVALKLNNRYSLDGRDPNGYAGVAWAIGGMHDRPWPSRPVFGNIRFMSRKGCESKFDVPAYIAKITGLSR